MRLLTTPRSRRFLRRRGATAASAALATAMVVALTACGGDDEGGSDGDVELRFSWWGNDQRAADTQRAIDAFEEANPGITVHGEPSDFDAYFDRIATEVAAGGPPDVITMGGAYPGEYGGRGALLDLDTVSDVLDTSNIEESALSNGVFDGVQYGMPTGVNTYGLVADPAQFEAAGVPMPDDDTWSWEDFVDIADQLAGNLPEDTYALPDPTAAETLELFSLHSTGTGLYTAEGGLGITEQSFIDWWNMTLGLTGSGATPEASLTSELLGQPNPEQTLIGRGQAAMQFDWSNQLPALREASGNDLVLLRVPGESTGQVPGMWLQASQLYTISADSDHPEEAAMLVDFLVNSVEAGQEILTDRGVPANSEVLAAITPELDEHQQATADFIARVLPVAGRPLVVGPEGSTETQPIIDRYNEEVLFERMSPEEAAAAAIGEIQVAIGA